MGASTAIYACEAELVASEPMTSQPSTEEAVSERLSLGQRERERDMDECRSPRLYYHDHHPSRRARSTTIYYSIRARRTDNACMPLINTTTRICRREVSHDAYAGTRRQLQQRLCQ